MILLIVLAVLFTYWGGVIYTARKAYANTRPSRVPVCGKKKHEKLWALHFVKEEDGHNHIPAGATASTNQYHKFHIWSGEANHIWSGEANPGEIPSCYGPYTQNRSLAIAAASGFLWPFLLVGYGAVNAVTGKQKDRPAEQEYKSKIALEKAEAELAKVTAELEEAKKK